MAVARDRQSIIAPILATVPGSRERGAAFRQVAAQPAHRLGDALAPVSQRTLRAWGRDAEQTGAAGLVPKVRKDRGVQRVQITLEAALHTTLHGAFAPAPDVSASISAHRRQHRPGALPKIATDPELQVFIAARLDHMTYKQIEEDVAANLPPHRHVRKSAIHDWFRKQQASPSNR